MNTLKQQLITLLFFTAGLFSFAQVGIGTTTPKAALDVVSTTQGFIMPRVSTADRNNMTVGADQNGMQVYDTDTKTVWLYNHSTASWIQQAVGASGAGGTRYVGTSILGITSGAGGAGNSEGGAPNLNNNFFGTDTGFSNTIGNNNNFFGKETGKLNTSGSDNNFFGTGVGFSNTSGSDNNFFGTNVGVSNTTGSDNNFFGTNAGGSNTTGSDNNFFGRVAGYYNTSGHDNIFIGDSAGQYLILSSVGAWNQASRNSIFLGGSIRSASNVSTNEIVIGSSADGLGSNTVVLGNNGIVTTALKGAVGIGTTAPTQALDVRGSARIDAWIYDENNEKGVAGQILSTTATGVDWIDKDGLVANRVSISSLSAVANSVYTITDSNTPANQGFPILVSYEDAAGNVTPVNIHSRVAGTSFDVNFTSTPDPSGFLNYVFPTPNATRTLTGTTGPSAYDLAVAGGFSGTQADHQAYLEATDDQELSLSGNNLSISGGTTVIDIATATAVVDNTAKVTDDDEGVAEVYAASWDGKTEAPTKDDVYDKLAAVDAVTATIDDEGVAELYGISWNGKTEAPTKDDVYDKLATVDAVVAQIGVKLFGTSLVGKHSGPGGTGTSEGTASNLNNNFLGLNAGGANTTGNYNNFLGLNAGGANTTGGYNSFLGANAGRGNTSGNANIAIGSDSGRYLSGGTFMNQGSARSIFIGDTTKSGANISQWEVVIGSEAESIGSHTVVLGNNNIVTTALKGAVGIGTIAPTDQLHVDGDLRITGAIKDGNNSPGTPGQLLSSRGSGMATEWITTPSSVSVGTVSTSLAAGSTPTVTDSGTASAVVLDFDFPAPIVKGSEPTDGTNHAFTITNSGITPASVVKVSYYNNSNEIINHAITTVAAGSFTVQFAAVPASGGSIFYTVLN
ncbi:MAG: beta strand repeat-containing protein [Flavobacteriaceae bacterium]